MKRQDLKHLKYSLMKRGMKEPEADYHIQEVIKAEKEANKAARLKKKEAKALALKEGLKSLGEVK